MATSSHGALSTQYNIDTTINSAAFINNLMEHIGENHGKYIGKTIIKQDKKRKLSDMECNEYLEQSLDDACIKSGKEINSLMKYKEFKSKDDAIKYYLKFFDDIDLAEKYANSDHITIKKQKISRANSI
jgi:hypothetical protein